MGILPSCCHVSTIAWLHHVDFDEVLVEKAKWELLKNATCCFEQILKVAFDKIDTYFLSYKLSE